MAKEGLLKARDPDTVYRWLDRYVRQPELAWAYEAVGHSQPLARRSHAADTCFRLVATQDVIRLHRCADDWPRLKSLVAAFLDRFANGSPDLLRYVGLLPY